VREIFQQSTKTKWNYKGEENWQYDLDLEYITTILGSFTNPDTTSIETFNQETFNFQGHKADAKFQACKKHKMTPLKFNYKQCESLML